MKFSYRWLRELVPGLEAKAEELHRLITMKTAESEGVERYGAHFATVIAARVQTVEALPKGKNHLVTIDAGTGAPITVVCGASNVRPGLVTAWVPPGTVLDDEQIGVAMRDGVQSHGMLASSAELGINREHAGVLELQGAEPGDPLSELAEDWILEIDNKSLTHRPDLWGHYGMAREVAAITHGVLHDPVPMNRLPKAETEAVHVEIEDFRLCPRYSALLLEGVCVKPSPLWFQARLESVGLNAINNIVDVTNYVLAELPQPMHAFDADKLQGDTIFVRRARAGETLAALNGETYELDAADLVIADGGGPIALAGVIGGAESAISETTTRVVLESACFDPSSVRLSSARHKLRTDASMRFEKSLDPENTVRGLARALELIENNCPGVRAVGAVSDRRGPVRVLPPIVLSVDFVSRKLGVRVAQEQVWDILSALGFGVKEQTPGVLEVTVPSWRATKDISLRDDLVEEVGRMIGYGEIPPAAPMAASLVPPANPARNYRRRLREQLASQGFTEVYNYSFVNEQEVQRFSLDIDSHVGVRNPIASELTHLRRSLLPGLFKNLLSNVRNFSEFRIFELGYEIHASGATSLPEEISHLAALLYSVHGDEQDFFEMKRVLECLFTSARVFASDPYSYEHPARAATVEWRGTEIGRLFELHPSLLREQGIEGRAFLFDIDVRAAEGLAAQRVVKYVPLRKYPTSGFDLSVVASMTVPVAQIEDRLRHFAGDRLVSIEFVRQYAGPPFAEGEKSVSYHLEVGATDHTLTADEVTRVRTGVIEGMRAAGFELRV